MDSFSWLWRIPPSSCSEGPGDPSTSSSSTSSTSFVIHLACTSAAPAAEIGGQGWWTRSDKDAHRHERDRCRHRRGHPSCLVGIPSTGPCPRGESTRPSAVDSGERRRRRSSTGCSEAPARGPGRNQPPHPCSRSLSERTLNSWGRICRRQWASARSEFGSAQWCQASVSPTIQCAAIFSSLSHCTTGERI